MALGSANAGTSSAKNDVDERTLLVIGGDDRLVIDKKTGNNKYNTPNKPCPAAIRRSSTTSNVVSERGFAAVQQLRSNLRRAVDKDAAYQELMDDVRSRIKTCYELCDGVEAVLSPSGSDAEFVPLLTALACRPVGGVLNIVTAAGEVGSGTSNACCGCHFSSLLPSGLASANGAPTTMKGAGTDFLQTKEVLVRDARSGALRSATDVEAEIITLVEAAIDADRSVVVHLVAGSKTGACTPSEQFARDLSARFGREKMKIVVDACQLRVQQDKVREWLAEDWQILITGSKFFAGPPFCGATLLPSSEVAVLNDLACDAELSQCVTALSDYFDKECVPFTMPEVRALLPSRKNVGLLARWSAALAEMEPFLQANQLQRAGVIQRWVGNARTAVEERFGFEQQLLRLLPLEDEDSSDGIPLGGTNSLLAFEVFVPEDSSSSSSLRALNQDDLKLMHKMLPLDLLPLVWAARGVIPTPTVEDCVALSRSCYIGQPVKLGASTVAIRFAIDAPMVNDVLAAADHEKSLQEALSDDRMLVRKIHFIARYWHALLKSDSVKKSDSVQESSGQPRSRL